MAASPDGAHRARPGGWGGELRNTAACEVIRVTKGARNPREL
jgi:hypothetical protein